MADYRATVPDDAARFNYNGDQHRPGRVFETDNACQTLDFAQAYEGANQDRGRADESPGIWAAMEAECPLGPAAAPVAAHGSPPVQQDRIPSGGDYAAAKGAPRTQATPIQGGTRIGSGGGGQGEPPAPGQEPTRPPSGQADPNLSRERPQAQSRGGDPVDLFSGALSLQETDIRIPNTILPLALMRTLPQRQPRIRSLRLELRSQLRPVCPRTQRRQCGGLAELLRGYLPVRRRGLRTATRHLRASRASSRDAAYFDLTADGGNWQ